MLGFHYCETGAKGNKLNKETKKALNTVSKDTAALPTAPEPHSGSQSRSTGRGALARGSH